MIKSKWFPEIDRETFSFQKSCYLYQLLINIDYKKFYSIEKKIFQKDLTNLT